MSAPPDNEELNRVVAERLAAVHERIRRAGGVDVAVLPVTKMFGLEHCWAAYRAGCTAVGENYAQEVAAKFGAERPPFAVHFIGQLQTNKVRLLAPRVDVYESVDRPSLVRELSTRAPGARVLIQVAPSPATSASASTATSMSRGPTAAAGKGGCHPDDVPALVDAARAAGLDVLGLMTVGPTQGGADGARPGFRAVRAMVDRLGLTVCSMGMTDDLEVAVQEGATQVRIGSALFGDRPHSESSVR